MADRRKSGRDSKSAGVASKRVASEARRTTTGRASKESSRQPESAAARAATRRARRRKRLAAQQVEEPEAPPTTADVINQLSADAARKAQEREEEEERERQARRAAKKEKKRKAREAAEKARLERERAEAGDVPAAIAEPEGEEDVEPAEDSVAEDEEQEGETGTGNTGADEEIDDEEDVEIERSKPRTRLAFKLIGAALVMFLVWLGYRWATTGKDPDIISEEGQEELLKDLGRDMNKLSRSVSDVGSWGLGELEEMIMGKPPQTEAEIAALMDESKKQIEANEKKKEEKKAPPPEKTVKPRTVTHKTTRPKYTRRPRTRRKSKSKSDTRLASARRIYQQAISHYIKADPRRGNITQAQQYIKRAKPLFERCLDECSRLRKSGVRHRGLGRLEQQAAMRLYDCNKRMIMR